MEGRGQCRDGLEWATAGFWRVRSKREHVSGRDGCICSVFPQCCGYKMTCLNVPLKAKGSSPVTLVVTAGSAKQILGCVMVLLWEL